MVHENGRGRIPGDSQNRGQIENGARSENPPSDGYVQKRKAVKEERKTTFERTMGNGIEETNRGKGRKEEQV